MELIDKATLARRLGKSTRTIDRMRQTFDLHAVGPAHSFPRFRWDAIVRDIDAGQFPRPKRRK